MQQSRITARNDFVMSLGCEDKPVRIRNVLVHIHNVQSKKQLSVEPSPSVMVCVRRVSTGQTTKAIA